MTDFENGSSKQTIFRRVATASRVWSLSFGGLVYLAGAGINHFLGGNTQWQILWLGLFSVLCLQAAAYLLKTYFDWLDPEMRFISKEIPHKTVIQMRSVLLQTELVILTTGAVITAYLYILGVLNTTVLFILGIAFILTFFYGAPPFRIAYSGYGELAETLLVVILIPALAFCYQTGSLHRLLVMIFSPVALLYLALLIVFNLQKFGVKNSQITKDLVFHTGWKSGMILHNIFIFCAYGLLVVGVILGFPLKLAWPVLITFPIGLSQVYLMNRIAGGAPPNWAIIRLVGAALPGIMAYQFLFTLWIS